MEKLMIPEILDTIKVLTVEELMELVKACEKEFDVSAAANIVVQKDPHPPVIPQTEFDVELTAFGPQKIKVIKRVHEITGLGLKEAKTLVDRAPVVIKEGVSIEEAETLKAKLEELGATITVK